MAELWMIRHFRTPWNAEGRLQGSQDVALSDPLNTEDAAALARNIAALKGVHFEEVLTSPLERARQTARLHGFAAAETDPNLAELRFGDWEGRTWADLEAAHPGGWHHAPQNLPLGESFPVFLGRIEAVLNRAARAGAPVLAFGHGGWMAALQSVMAGEAGMTLADYPARNGLLLRVPL